MKTFITVILTIAVISVFASVSVNASLSPPIPQNLFGAHDNNGDIHINMQAPTGSSICHGLPHTDKPIHFHPSAAPPDGNAFAGPVHLSIHGAPINPAGQWGFDDGEHIGVLTVHRLNRVVNVFEGETMRNMDFGAGRYTFTGANFGNTALIGHNRGRTNGFFSFVRELQEGDLLTLEMNGVTRTYEVIGVFIIEETDFTPLMDFGDHRLTLVTCLEYRPQYRRIAISVAV